MNYLFLWWLCYMFWYVCDIFVLIIVVLTCVWFVNTEIVFSRDNFVDDGQWHCLSIWILQLYL